MSFNQLWLSVWMGSDFFEGKCKIIYQEKKKVNEAILRRCYWLFSVNMIYISIYQVNANLNHCKMHLQNITTILLPHTCSDWYSGWVLEPPREIPSIKNQKNLIGCIWRRVRRATAMFERFEMILNAPVLFENYTSVYSALQCSRTV